MTHELAEEFFKSAEELIESKDDQEKLLEALDQAERVSPGDASLLCRSARLLFRYGILNSKGRFFILALDKLKAAHEQNPDFFDQYPMWSQLWGNILIQLGKILNDSTFIEMALEKFKSASNGGDVVNTELYWDWGEAWVLLGQKSQEIGDLQQGLTKFYQAHSEGLHSDFFHLDYAFALLHYSNLTGDPRSIENALFYLRSVIQESYCPDQEPSVTYHVAWRKMAHAMTVRYQLTHSKEHFEEADTCFREAILATPGNCELLLDWGEMYLHAGWLKRDIKFVEAGLEKLTAAKIKECDPLKVSSSLGSALIIFGLFLENLKLIKEGQERIRSALHVAPDHVELNFASGFADLCCGLYFSDETLFARAAANFEKAIQENATSVKNWHALFQTYLAWGLKLHDSSLVQKGIQAIMRLCQLRPFSCVYLNEWGVSLLRLRTLETNPEHAKGYIEEALMKFCKSSELCEDDETLYNWGCAFDLLGQLTADEGDYLKAIDLLTKIFEKRPSELHVRYHLGLCLSHLGELTLNADYLRQAVDLLESVVKVDQEDEGIWSEWGYALLNLAELVLDSHYPEEGEKIRREAEKALARAAELGSGDARYYLACLYSLTGHYTASLHYLKKAEEVGALPSEEELEHDEWLEGVKKTDAFREFLMTREKDG